MKDLNRNIRDLQKEVACKNLKFFATTYFGHYCKCSFAPFHLELFDCLTEITLEERGRQVAIAAPRGNAKSSIVSLIYVLWCICYGYEQCILIFSSTRKQSEKLLAHIKDELSSNEKLRGDFPEVCEPPNPRWRNDEIITKNGINVVSSSVEHGIRGIRHKENRPSLIILDDVEAIESIRSQDQREKIYKWFTEIVLHLGSENTNYIVVGTILHFDSLLAKLTSKDEFPACEKMIYKSVIKFSDRQDLWDKWGQIYRGKELYKEGTGPEAAKKFFDDNKVDMLKGTKVLWPEKETYYDLMVMMEQKGRSSFDSEKQNEPKDTTGLSIDMKKAEFWEDKHQTLEELQAFLENRKMVIGACDPSVGKGRKSDYSAIVNVYLDYARKDLYVVDADVGRWGFNTLAERICLHHKTRGFTIFIYEANAAQAWLGETISKAPVAIPIKPVTNVAPKDARIMKLMLLIEQGKVKLSRRLTELNRQLEQYPYGDHDDAVDALAMIIEEAEEFSQLDSEQSDELFRIANGLPPKNSKRIISLGGKDVDDPFGLMSVF
jgi:predicted phage terminase large subunit-like protein